MCECEHGPAFPIGGLGDGSIVFIDLESGKVRGYNNDYADLEEISESFSELILDLVEQVESFSVYNIWYKGHVMNDSYTISGVPLKAVQFRFFIAKKSA